MRPKQIYILPNILTSVNILAGMFCIVMASSGKPNALWYSSAVLFIGMMADVFDGIIARLQNAASEFGVQYDSLADVISFGVAPAVLAFHIGLSRLPGRIGPAIAFLFTVCAAMRLARYNIQATTGEKKSFAGLPTPAAAGFIASAGIVIIRYDVVESFTWPLAIAMIVLSLLMISKIRYPSSTDLILVGRKPFVYLTVGTLAIAGALFFVEESLFAGFAIYAVYGITNGIYRFFYPLPELGADVTRKRIRHLFLPRRKGSRRGRFRKSKSNKLQD